MKTFKQVLAEIATAKSPADKEFVALHTTTKKQFTKHPETQFKGGTKKDHSKAAGPSNATGMEDDVNATKPVHESEDEYSPHKANRFNSKEEAQKVVDKLRAKHKDGNFVVDEPTKKTGGKHTIGHAYYGTSAVNKHIKNLKEETEEQLDELSKETLARYGAKADSDYQTRSHFGRGKENEKKLDKRGEGLDRAGRLYNKKKLTKEEMDAMSFDEIVEFNLQEISKATLGSYIKKASADQTRRSKLATQQRAQGYEYNVQVGMRDHAKVMHDNADKHEKKLHSREKNINKATDKLTK